jgi:hypothetical protein
METRKIIVSRSIVIKHLPHPEYYGESIVKLANGFTTDVYTDLDGSLFTMTNNKKLMHYLSKHQIKDEPTSIKTDHLLLKSITIKDLEQIHEWFLISPFRRAQSVENEIDIVYEYISHAKTINSDVFIVSNKDKPIGLIGYSIIDNVGLLNCDVYNHLDITIYEVNNILENVKNYLTKRYNLNKLLLHVFEYDSFIQNMLSQSVFKKSQDKIIKIPTLSGSMQQIEYAYLVKKI